MSNSENKKNHLLKIIISQEYKYLVKILVYNSSNRIIEGLASNSNEIIFSIPKGIYTLRIEMNGDIKDEIVLLDKEKVYQIGDKNTFTGSNTKIISPPKQFSSALLGETYGSSHEYYTNPAIEWSKKETFQFNQDSSETESSLFIFLRFPSLEKFDMFRSSFSNPFYYDFEIVDEYGSVITQFESRNGIELNEEQGWIAFNGKLSYGVYYLLYKGKEPRQIPIYIYKNWHTQFFMTLGSQPLFGTTRIFLSRQREFNPNESTYKYIDVLLDKLQNQDFTLDNELIKMAAYGKYESPMLGLICSYIYLQSKETKSDNLFNIIYQNMQNVILKDNEESPDLRALNILASNHFPNYKYKKGNVKGTPMLRIGFETILKASVQNKRLIPQNSINDFISENIYFDSPFNTFKPIPFKKKPTHKYDNIEKSLPTKEDELLGTIKSNSTDLTENSSQEEILHIKNINLNPKVDKFNISIKNLFDDSLFSYIHNTNEPDIENSWIKNSIADIVKTKNDISINDISNNLNVSGNTVTRIFNDWKKEAKKKYGK
jgi:hypothetical protein